MSSPTSTFDIDLDDERANSAGADVLGSSAAFEIRQLERDRRLREIERTFQNVVSEAESTEGQIYENVFTDRGDVHNEVTLTDKEYEIEQSRPKSMAGKLKEKAINRVTRNNKTFEAFQFEVQSKTAAGNFDDFVPVSDFSSHKQHTNRPSSPNHARLVYNVAVLARKHSSKIAIAVLIFITMIVTTVTMTAFREDPISTLPEETWENLKVIRAALIDEGIQKFPLMDFDSMQFAAVTQLAEEASMKTLSIRSITNNEEVVVSTTTIKSAVVPSDFNNAYMERRIVLERYILLCLYYTTSSEGKEWKKKTNWLANNINVCSGWHGIKCMTVVGNDISFDIVTEIHLSSNDIYGKIPLELSSMSQLQDLSLSNNFLVGQIPKSLGEIKNLKKVDLSRNQITGDVPSTFCNLKLLVELITDCGVITCACCTECL